jgi:hypothetical protein
MKIILLALALSMTTVAAAQQMQMPATINLVDNKTGEKIGTATTMPGSGVFYLRDNKGKFIATVVREGGKIKAYDESGKPLDMVPGNITVPE